LLRLQPRHLLRREPHVDSFRFPLRHAYLLADFMLPVANPKILVVEDDDAVRRLLMENLVEQIPVDVDAARDGVEALHMVTPNKYGVGILRHVMTALSGADLHGAPPVTA